MNNTPTKKESSATFQSPTKRPQTPEERLNNLAECHEIYAKMFTDYVGRIQGSESSAELAEIEKERPSMESIGMCQRK